MVYTRDLSPPLLVNSQGLIHITASGFCLLSDMDHDVCLVSCLVSAMVYVQVYTKQVDSLYPSLLLVSSTSKLLLQKKKKISFFFKCYISFQSFD